MTMHWLSALQAFIRRSCDEHLQWRLSRSADVAELRKTNALAEQALVAELRKQAQRLEYELEMNKARQHGELEMVRAQHKQDVKDYRQYLQALDRLKVSLRNSYAHMPEAVAFTIHHHAKQLLNRMWEAEDNHEKVRMELQLLQLMAAVHEDSQVQLQGGGRLPQKTLALIDDDSAFK